MKFCQILREQINANINYKTLTSCSKFITKAYNNSKYTTWSGNTILKPYWWCEEIQRLKEIDNKKRRKLTGINRKEGREEEKTLAWEEYVASRNHIKQQIRKNKKDRCKEIYNKLEEDVWGDGYRIATKELKQKSLPYKLTNDKEDEIIRGPFPTRHDKWTLIEENENEDDYNNKKFSEEEIICAGKKSKQALHPARTKFRQK